MTITEKLHNRHELVKKKVEEFGGQVIFTALVGSQNYGLDSEKSDLDTFTFIFPKLEDYVCGSRLCNTETELEDGKYIIKDIRLAIQSLRKSNPNSLEYFTTPYKMYELPYAITLFSYLNKEHVLKQMLHADFKRMADSIAGMSKMIAGRNMTIGKQYSHCLRLAQMFDTYYNLDHSTQDYLPLNSALRRLAYAAKYEEHDDERNKLFYQNECSRISNELCKFADELVITDAMKDYQNDANTLITSFLMELFNDYLKENGYEI